MSESSLRLLLIFFSFMISHKIIKCFLRAFVLAMSSSVLASQSKSTFNVQCMIHVYAVFWFITPPKITSNLTCTYNPDTCIAYSFEGQTTYSLYFDREPLSFECWRLFSERQISTRASAATWGSTATVMLSPPICGSLYQRYLNVN